MLCRMWKIEKITLVKPIIKKIDFTWYFNQYLHFLTFHLLIIYVQVVAEYPNRWLCFLIFST